MLNSELVVFIRPTAEKTLAYLYVLKKKGIKVVYSIDDLFGAIDRQNPHYEELLSKKHVEDEFLKYSDTILVTNRIIEKRLKKYNPNICIVPNYIDENDFYSKKRKIKKIINIGIVGSVSTQENIGEFIDILKEIIRGNAVGLIFFGNEDQEMIKRLKDEFGSKAKFLKSVPMFQYPRALAEIDLDIALIPRKNNLFNRAKSNCKYLEMSLAGIPVVAQGYISGDSPYQIDIRDGISGFVAINKNDWLKKTQMLIADKNLREKISKNAAQFVRDNYLNSKNSKVWLNFLVCALNSLNQSTPNVNILITGIRDLASDASPFETPQYNLRLLADAIVNKREDEIHKIINEIKKYKLNKKYSILISIYNFNKKIGKILFFILRKIGKISEL